MRREEAARPTSPRPCETVKLEWPTLKYTSGNVPVCHPENGDDFVAENDIGQAHAPKLVRMVRDRSLATALAASPPSWAPFHALHILESLDLASHVADLLPIHRRSHPGGAGEPA